MPWPIHNSRAELLPKQAIAQGRHNVTFPYYILHLPDVKTPDLTGVGLQMKYYVLTESHGKD